MPQVKCSDASTKTQGRQINKYLSSHHFLTTALICSVCVCVCVCVCASSVIQSCLTLCDPMDCSPPGSSVYGVLQARTLELVAISSSRKSSRLRDQTLVSCVSCTVGRFFSTRATCIRLLGLP